MNIRTWLAAGAAAALALGVSSAASASTAGAARPVSHPAPVSHKRGFHVVTNVHLPRTALQHLTPKATAYSYNWSGYAAVGGKGVSLRYISADYNVPSVNCAASPTGTEGTYEGQWIGFDGYNENSDTVEQTGIAGYCNDGTPEYYAWYEIYPQDPVVYSGPINPGDAITSSVYYNDSTHLYNIILTDVTSGVPGINVNVPCTSGYTCPDATAEVISEVPGGGPYYGVDLADFGMENFTNTGVTSHDGVHGSLAASKLWSSSEIVMQSETSGATMVQPSSLYGGLAFNDTWRAGD
jgi:Peptidase A4 family